MKANFNTGAGKIRAYNGQAQSVAANAAGNVPALRVIVAAQAEMIAALIARISVLEGKLA